MKEASNTTQPRSYCGPERSSPRLAHSNNSLPLCTAHAGGPGSEHGAPPSCAHCKLQLHCKTAQATEAK